MSVDVSCSGEAFAVEMGEEVAAGGVWFRSELAGFSEDAWSGLLSLLQASVSKLSVSVRSSAVICMIVGCYR